jgi:hypothetical protein
MVICSKSTIYANVRITATLPERCNILIVKSFGGDGPDLFSKRLQFKHSFARFADGCSQYPKEIVYIHQVAYFENWINEKDPFLRYPGGAYATAIFLCPVP